LTREQLQALRDSLPPWGEERTSTPELEAYARFYGLQFDTAHGISHRIGTVNSGAYKLAVQGWQHADAAATLLLVHGYFDHTGLYNKLVAFGLANGCNVLMFDLPGHGLSTGEPAVIAAFADYGRAVRDVLAVVSPAQGPLWVMAQSTGCSALIEFARHNDWPFGAAVLLAPLVRPRAWGRIRLAHLLLNQFRDSVPRRFSRNSADQDFLNFVRRDPLQSRQASLRWIGALQRWLSGLRRQDLGVGPAMIVQGDRDRTVDWRYNLEFVTQLFPQSRVEIIPGAGHQLANESAVIREQYLQRVIDYLETCNISLASRCHDPGDCHE